MKTLTTIGAISLCSVAFLLSIPLLDGTSSVLAGTLTGNVPSIEKIGDSWSVKSIFPSMTAYKLVDDTGKDLCMQRIFFVGVEKGVINENAIRIEQFTFEEPQQITAQGKQYRIKAFAFAFHGQEDLYSKIKELKVDKELVGTGDAAWCCTDAKGKTLSLTKWQLPAKDECKAVYSENVSVSYKEFRQKVLKTK